MSTMMTVEDAMTRSVVTVHPDLPLKNVARLLVGHRVSGLPVVDAEDRVLGVVSEADLLVKESGSAAVGHRRLERVRGTSKETRKRLAKVVATTAGGHLTALAPGTAYVRAEVSGDRRFRPDSVAIMVFQPL